MSQQLALLVGAEESVATFLLESAAWDIERACNLYFEQQGDQGFAAGVACALKLCGGNALFDRYAAPDS